MVGDQRSALKGQILLAGERADPFSVKGSDISGEESDAVSGEKADVSRVPSIMMGQYENGSGGSISNSCITFPDRELFTIGSLKHTIYHLAGSSPERFCCWRMTLSKTVLQVFNVLSSAAEAMSAFCGTR